MLYWIQCLTHSYSRSGVFYPAFTVTDDKGQAAKTSISVNVGNYQGYETSIQVLSPNGGETFQVGKTYRISWKSKGVNSVHIYVENLKISGSVSTNYIVPNNASISASQGYYDWTIADNTLPGAPIGGSDYGK